MHNTVKERIRAGGKAVGTFHELGCTAATECLALAGLEYIIIDCEHGPFDVESAERAILAAERHGCMPFARARDTSRTSLLKLLDIGAMGLIVPFLHGIEDAKAIVAHAKYAPLGNRGFSHARVSGFGSAAYAQTLASHTATANAETLLIPQCETAGCLKDIDEIAALPGIDGIFIGPYDLSIALGIPGAFTHARFQEAVADVLAACKRHQKFSFIFAGTAELARAYLAQGFDSAAVGLDAMLLMHAARALRASVLE